MQRLRILVILILLSLMPLYSLAVLNEGQYAFRSLDINNGLSQNTVHAILQDKQGFMWFGTKDGLDRYDGISFRTFMKESGTLGNNFITSLYEDNLGQIWIGTDVGLYVYCPQMEKVRHFTLKMPGSYPINAASTVCRPTGTCGILKRPRLSVIVPAPSFSDSFTVAYGIGNFESPSITIPRMVCTGRPFRPVVWLNTVTDTNKAVNNRIHPP